MKVLTTSVPSLLSKIIYYTFIGIALEICQLKNNEALRYSDISHNTLK